MTLDDLLQHASSSDFTAYDPTAVIEAVNALIPLGKTGALAALDRFIAGCDLTRDPHQGLFLVMRVLFDAAPHPALRLGGSRLKPPDPAPVIPRFPILMVEDVPLMLVDAYELAGLPDQLSTHLDYYRQHGELIAPLRPAKVDRHAAFVQQFQQAYGVPPDRAELDHIDAQLGRLKL
ncbi:MAG TPA: hypothetical protein VHW23_28600 [Kofleriaceae bacterium]|nr:hypothetical protein [Kofleriaceae bacterium]